MKQIERRIRKLEAIDPAQRVRYFIGDCPEGDTECQKRRIAAWPSTT
jgi:hypothetical protein